MSKLYRHILDFPSAYRSFQNLLIKHKISLQEAFAHYINEKHPDYKIIDIGCGDAPIAGYFKTESDYIGLDYNHKYIEAAQKKYPHFKFTVGDVLDIDASSGKVIYLLLGVVHHLDDNHTKDLIAKIKKMNANASILCLDGIRVPKQNPIAKLMKDLDRGKFVRTLEGYQAVLEGFNFSQRSDLSNLPYNHVISGYNFDTADFNKFFDKLISTQG
jgi:ubiquinone/menaquinone biosynthesis C-methylase UbiE